MVGFGSSLRLARRSGWEDGYFDYETLKLLLSQIEAVYEEGEDQALRFHHGAEDESWYYPADPQPSFLRQDPFQQRQPHTATSTSAASNATRRRGRGPTTRSSSDDDKDEEGGVPNRRRRPPHHRRHKNHQGRVGDAIDDDSRHHRQRGAAAAADVGARRPRRDFREDIFLESDSDLEFAGSDEWGLRDHNDTGSHRSRRRRGGVGGGGASRGRFPSHDEDHMHRRASADHEYEDAYDYDDEEGNAETSDTGEYYDGTNAASNAYLSDPNDLATGTNGSAAAFYSQQPYSHNAFYMEGTGGDDNENANSEEHQPYYMESSSLLGGGLGAGSAISSGYQSTNPTSASAQGSTVFYSYGGDSLSLTPPHGVRMYPRASAQQPQSLQAPSMNRDSSGDSAGLVRSSRTAPTTTHLLSQPSLSPLTHASAMVVGGPTAAASYDLPPHPRSTPGRNGSSKKRGRTKLASGGGSVTTECACTHWCKQRARKRRRRTLRAKLKERERRVPRYLRVAHARARDITERFLGKLRAETEKVLLFAESRLGELADTLGSLRFPSDGSSTLMEGSFMGGRQHGQDRRTFEYPLLADGGMHPSSSSSDDEGFYSSRGGGAGARDGVAWSDSSDSNADRKSRTSSTQRSTHAKGVSSDDGVGSGKRGTVSVARPQSQKPPFLSSAKRQIAHYAEIRNSRPTFQRNDHILGEDLLFLSAIEEADAFTAVGVELMHVLRYICINLIAVRKICKRHDRLLMNRMLGGYYHRLKLNTTLNLRNTTTLGGLLAQASGDIDEAHPTLIGDLMHFKLEGVYDKKIQKLANSRTLQAISSCLALALSEYEVARTRANSLIKRKAGAYQPISPRSRSTEEAVLQPVLESNDEESYSGPPSTASTMSLTRLRFTVTSIFSLREAARFKLDHFDTYLSRVFSVFTGYPIAGEGMDGCSRATLDFLVAYNPDSALLLDCSVLFAGLKDGHWMHRPMSEVMTAALATGTVPETLPQVATVRSFITEQVSVVSRVFNLAPERKRDLRFKKQLGWGSIVSNRPSSFDDSSIRDDILMLNQVSALLFAMNYFVAHATTNRYVRSVGAEPAHTASIIGCPNLSACIVTLFHCGILSQRSLSGRSYSDDVRVFRWLFLGSSVFAAAGNVIVARSVVNDSIAKALLGRFLIGFGATDVLQRNVVGWCSKSHLAVEAARLVRYRVAGILVGLMTGAVADLFPFSLGGTSSTGIHSTSWMMMSLWLLHSLQIMLRFRSYQRTKLVSADESMSVQSLASDPGNVDESDSDSSESAEIGTPSSLLYQKSLDLPSENRLALRTSQSKESVVTAEADPAPQSTPNASTRQTTFSTIARQWKGFTSRLLKLQLYRLCIPLSFVVHAFASVTMEVIYTSSPIIASRYFGWSGAHAAAMLGACSAFILPTYFVCEWISRRYEERLVIKRSVGVISIGFFIMVNWLSLFSLSSRLTALFTDIEGKGPQVYDWHAGVYQFVVGVSTAVVGLVSLESANLSLLSKVSPQHLSGAFVNIGTLATLLTYFGRLCADVYILLVDLSHKLISTDLVNSIALPALLASVLLAYMIRKRYFFLL